MVSKKIKTSKDFGVLVKSIRNVLGVTQDDLALTSGTNRRFIVDLEKGKPTCQLGKALIALQTLGASVDVVLPRGVDLEDTDE
jgi:HTH-type transcriptional regulator/antitoxin HipB